MISALIVVALSAAIGRAICVFSGWHPSCLAPAVGFAALLVLGGAVQFVPGDALTVALLTAALAVAALFVRARPAPRSALVEGAAVVGIVLLLSSIPLLASGRAGILGAGNQNDMVQHLTTAHWLDARDGAQTVLVREGYPLGPHGTAAVIARATDMSLVHAFDGVTLAIPVLTALAALAALGGLPRPHRLVVASMSALCYLAASYLATGAFKETAEALFLLAFVLALRELRRGNLGTGWRAGIPLGVLAAGAVYTYSYLGLIWLIAAASVFALFELAGARGGWRERSKRALAAVPITLGGVGALVVLAAPQTGRMLEFARSSFSHQAIQGTGNLLHAISPVQALGVWLRADFRFNMPTAVTVAVGVIVGAAAVVALVWWLRKRDFALPSGFSPPRSSTGSRPRTRTSTTRPRAWSSRRRSSRSWLEPPWQPGALVLDGRLRGARLRPADGRVLSPFEPGRWRFCALPPHRASWHCATGRSAPMRTRPTSRRSGTSCAGSRRSTWTRTTSRTGTCRVSTWGRGRCSTRRAPSGHDSKSRGMPRSRSTSTAGRLVTWTRSAT